MSETDFRVDPLTGAPVVVTPWRQDRPNLPDGRCPFCPGEAFVPRTTNALKGPVCVSFVIFNAPVMKYECSPYQVTFSV